MEFCQSLSIQFALIQRYPGNGAIGYQCIVSFSTEMHINVIIRI